MNLRKFLLPSIVVLLVCQLGFAASAPDKTTVTKALAANVQSGQPVRVVPLTQADKHHARPNIILFHSGPMSKAQANSEPYFPCNTGNIYGGYTFCPSGLQGAYGTKQISSANGGSGSVIAIVDAYAYANAESDLAHFNAVMGLPPCTTANGCFTSVNLSPYDGSGSGWDIESMLDLESAHAMAPNAKIIYVQAYDNSYDGLGQADDIAAKGCPGSVYCAGYGVASSPAGDVVSNSWSGGEYTYYDFYWNQSVPMLYASGDGGSFYYTGPGYPCTALTVSCIGGTSLYVNSQLQRTSEVGWIGSGGGCSLAEPIPSWQGNVGSGVCSPYRATPDIAADADPYTGFELYICNVYSWCGWAIYGGTSLATPITAGLVADIDTARVAFGKGKLTFLNTEFYAAATYNYNYYFYDVVYGTNDFYGNGFYNAGPQFDLVTGLGNATGKALASRFFGIP